MTGKGNGGRAAFRYWAVVTECSHRTHIIHNQCEYGGARCAIRVSGSHGDILVLSRAIGWGVSPGPGAIVMISHVAHCSRQAADIISGIRISSGIIRCCAFIGGNRSTIGGDNRRNIIDGDRGSSISFTTLAICYSQPNRKTATVGKSDGWALRGDLKCSGITIHVPGVGGYIRSPINAGADEGDGCALVARVRSA